METINKKGPADLAYIAGLHGAKVGIYATSLHVAKQRAIEHFRPKKRDVSLIWVARAED